MKLNKLSGDCDWREYGAKWITPKLSNGEFDYWIVLEFTNMDEACGRDNEGHPRYNVYLSAVSPDEAGKENLRRAFDCCGIDPDSELASEPVVQVECLHSYGVSAALWQSSGDNANKLMAEARKQVNLCESLFGFYMDGAKNRIRSTVWEFLRGDLDSGLRRAIASGSTEGRILAKMHGQTLTA